MRFVSIVFAMILSSSAAFGIGKSSSKPEAQEGDRLIDQPRSPWSPNTEPPQDGPSIVLTIPFDLWLKLTLPRDPEELLSFIGQVEDKALQKELVDSTAQELESNIVALQGQLQMKFIDFEKFEIPVDGHPENILWLKEKNGGGWLGILPLGLEYSGDHEGDKNLANVFLVQKSPGSEIPKSERFTGDLPLYVMRVNDAVIQKLTKVIDLYRGKKVLVERRNAHDDKGPAAQKIDLRAEAALTYDLVNGALSIDFSLSKQPRFEVFVQDWAKLIDRKPADLKSLERSAHAKLIPKITSSIEELQKWKGRFLAINAASTN